MQYNEVLKIAKDAVLNYNQHNKQPLQYNTTVCVIHTCQNRVYTGFSKVEMGNEVHAEMDALKNLMFQSDLVIDSVSVFNTLTFNFVPPCTQCINAMLNLHEANATAVVLTPTGVVQLMSAEQTFSAGADPLNSMQPTNPNINKYAYLQGNKGQSGYMQQGYTPQSQSMGNVPQGKAGGTAPVSMQYNQSQNMYTSYQQSMNSTQALSGNFSTSKSLSVPLKTGQTFKGSLKNKLKNMLIDESEMVEAAVLNSMETEPNETDIQKQLEKEQKQAEKQAIKEQRLAERQAEREQKAAVKQAEKEQKVAERIAEKQKQLEKQKLAEQQAEQQKQLEKEQKIAEKQRQAEKQKERMLDKLKATEKTEEAVNPKLVQAEQIADAIKEKQKGIMNEHSENSVTETVKAEETETKTTFADRLSGISGRFGEMTDKLFGGRNKGVKANENVKADGETVVEEIKTEGTSEAIENDIEIETTEETEVTVDSNSGVIMSLDSTVPLNMPTSVPTVMPNTEGVAEQATDTTVVEEAPAVEETPVVEETSSITETSDNTVVEEIDTHKTEQLEEAPQTESLEDEGNATESLEIVKEETEENKPVDITASMETSKPAIPEVLQTSGEWSDIAEDAWGDMEGVEQREVPVMQHNIPEVPVMKKAEPIVEQPVIVPEEHVVEETETTTETVSTEAAEEKPKKKKFSLFGKKDK